MGYFRGERGRGLEHRVRFRGRVFRFQLKRPRPGLLRRRPEPASASRPSRFTAASSRATTMALYQTTFAAARGSAFRAVRRSNPLGTVNVVGVKIGGRYRLRQANQHCQTRRSPLAALRRESSGKDLHCLRPDSAHGR